MKKDVLAMNTLTGCLVLLLIFALLIYAWPLLLVLAVIAIIYQIYAALYFKSEKFNTILKKKYKLIFMIATI